MKSSWIDNLTEKQLLRLVGVKTHEEVRQLILKTGSLSSDPSNLNDE